MLALGFCLIYICSLGKLSIKTNFYDLKYRRTLDNNLINK